MIFKQFKILKVVLLTVLLSFLSFQSVFAQNKLEKTKVSIAVGGKNLFYYLPLTIAERLGYFKDEGLDVEISDFPGGAKALQALVGGSADVVSGAYEHTINMQAKGQNILKLIPLDTPQIRAAINLVYAVENNKELDTFYCVEDEEWIKAENQKINNKINGRNTLDV